MKEGKPSLTAELACACRAAESLKPAHKRVCYDPLARHFVRLLLRLIARSRLLVQIILWEAERLAPGVPGEVIGRTRYIDDLLKVAYEYYPNRKLSAFIHAYLKARVNSRPAQLSLFN